VDAVTVIGGATPIAPLEGGLAGLIRDVRTDGSIDRKHESGERALFDQPLRKVSMPDFSNAKRTVTERSLFICITSPTSGVRKRGQQDLAASARRGDEQDTCAFMESERSRGRCTPFYEEWPLDGKERLPQPLDLASHANSSTTTTTGSFWKIQ
jgi:hypothetical protein